MKRQVFNPYLPSWEYVPDGEPHVFGDRLYIFGSHDIFDSNDYCLEDYVCWSTPIDDLSDWRYEGVIYRKDQTPWNTDNKSMYAPDACQGPDGRYYLYYSVQNSSVTSVAVCDTPAGKYEYYGDVHFTDGRVHGSSPEDWFDFDPSIMVDTDGRIWLYSGSGQTSNGKYGHPLGGSFVMELDQDMLTIISEPKIVLPADWSTKKPNFFEGTSARHIGDLYYIVCPATDMTGLNYYTCDRPDGEFEWKGIIHSTSDIGLNGDKNMNHAKYPMGNNHGGLVCVKDQWYIFDHRQCNGSAFGRQGVAEKITIKKDGSIDMVEATSCGLNDGPLRGIGTYPAYICCNLMKKGGLIKLPPFGKMAGAWVTQDGPDYNPPEPTADHEVNIESEKNAPIGFVHVEKKGVLLGYKYFDVTDTKKISIKYRSKGKGSIEILAAEDGDPVARIAVNPSEDWTEVSCDLTADLLATSGNSIKKMPIYLLVKAAKLDILEFTLE